MVEASDVTDPMITRRVRLPSHPGHRPGTGSR